MAPRVPKGVSRDPHVRTIADPDYRFARSQPLLEDWRSSPAALRDPLLPTWYLCFISFFFFACGCSIVLIQGV
jgi:hypothetical protein